MCAVLLRDFCGRLFFNKGFAGQSELTEKEKYYLASMNYRNPLIESDCEMNRICRYLESVDFEIVVCKYKS